NSAPRAAPVASKRWANTPSLFPSWLKLPPGTTKEPAAALATPGHREGAAGVHGHRGTTLRVARERVDPELGPAGRSARVVALGEHTPVAPVLIGARPGHDEAAAPVRGV